MATIGPKLDWPRNRREARPSPGWSAWARLVVRHRWVAAFTSLAVLILGLGIAGATTIFSVVKPVLLEPLDYPEADRLVRLGNRVPVPVERKSSEIAIEHEA